MSQFIPGKDLQEVADILFYFVEMKLIFHKKTQLKRGLVRDGRPVFLFWKIEKKNHKERPCHIPSKNLLEVAVLLGHFNYHISLIISLLN